jgi:replicative DNA helicase
VVVQVQPDRLPPHNVEAEVSVLGGMMLEADAADTGLGLLDASDFYQPEHAQIFRAIANLRKKDSLGDALSVRDELRAMGVYGITGGDDYLAQIVEVVPTAANLKYHAAVVRSNAQRRRLITACSRVQDRAYSPTISLDDLLDEAERQVFSATQTKDQGEGLVKVSRLVKNTLDLIHGGRKDTVTTGFAALDAMLGGFMPGELTVLAARPSMGKSALAFQVAMNVAIDHRTPVAIFSLEMPREQCVMRLLSNRSGVNLEYLVQGRADKISEVDAASLRVAGDELENAPLFIDSSGSLNIFELRAKARRLKAKHGVALIVVDYLQLMVGDGDNRAQEVGSISRGLKRLAGELGVPILALAQLNRAVESREDRRPRLFDLRDSGEIEQDADVVLFLYRDSYYKGEHIVDPTKAEVIISKQRNGPLGKLSLHFDSKRTRFETWNETRKHGF